MTETQLTAILSAFWHNGRNVFTPMTAADLDRKVKTHFNTRSGLVRRGLLASDGDRACPIYEITEAGKRIVRENLSRAAK
jgi:predicted transcriptional regulator